VDDEKYELDGLRKMDPQALTWIHQRYYPEVYRYVLYRVGDDHVAEDITSEVFLRLLEASRSKKGPLTSLRGWLLGTTAHLIDDHFRKHYAHPSEMLTEEIYTDEANPAILVEENERIRALRKALVQLTHEQQHVLALRFGNGYSLEQVATIMKKNINSVKALQFRAVMALRHRLEGENQ